MVETPEITAIVFLCPLGQRHVGRRPPHVRYGSLADMAKSRRDVCFTPNGGHWLAALECPLYANIGHHETLMQCLHCPQKRTLGRPTRPRPSLARGTDLRHQVGQRATAAVRLRCRAWRGHNEYRGLALRGAVKLWSRRPRAATLWNVANAQALSGGSTRLEPAMSPKDKYATKLRRVLNAYMKKVGTLGSKLIAGEITRYQYNARCKMVRAREKRDLKQLEAQYGQDNGSSQKPRPRRLRRLHVVRKP